MKPIRLILVLLSLGILAASLAWAQDGEIQEGVMDLKSREFGEHQRPMVKFDHYLHETSIRCRVCHHDFNVFSNRNDGKGSKCSGCHKREANKDIPVPLLVAFHNKCKGCHENYIKWGRASGPVMCGLCHKKT